MAKKFLSLGLVLVLCFLCGCTGYRESDNSFIVSAMGFDKEGGNFTIFIEAVTANETEAELKEETYEAHGETLEAALYSLKNKIYKPLSFEHCSVILVSPNIAQKDMKNVVEFCKKTEELNTSVYFAATEEVEKIISADAVSEAAGGYDISSLIESRDEEDGISYKNRLYELLSATDEFIPTFYLPFLKADDDKFHTQGELVYTDFSPSKKLNSDDSFILSVLTGRYGKGNVTLVGETAEIQDAHTYFKAEVKQNELYINLNAKFRFKTRSEGFLKEFENRAGKLLESQKDIFSFSKILNQKHPKEFLEIKESYRGIYKNSDIVLKVEEELF